MSRSKKNYNSHKLEFLALKWAITEKLSDYLIGKTFSVYTDNNPLTYTLTSAKRGANGHTEADALSRLPHTLIICMDTVKANCDSDQGHPLIESLP